MNRKLKFFLNLILLPLFAFAIYQVIESPHPNGKIALAVLIGTLFFNLIRNRFVAVPFYFMGLIGAVFILYASFSLNSYTQGQRSKFDIPTAVTFEKTDFETTLAKAKAENKPLFIDFYTAWCAPCLAFTKNVLTDEEVGIYMNETFINLKYDAEKGEGINIAKKYNVNSYPTLLIIDNKGKVLMDISDVSRTIDLITVIKKYRMK